MKTETKFNAFPSNTYFFVKDRMMHEVPHIWENTSNDTGGDDLWRTGWAYIVYRDKENILKQGILSCFTDEEDKKGKYIQAHRSPGLGSDDVSRDQITSALCSLKINGDTNDLKRIIKGLRWKISKKFSLSLDMWFWMKSISTKQPMTFIYSFLFALSSLIVTLPMVLWNKIIYKWAGLKEISQEEYTKELKAGGLKNTNENKKTKTATLLHYPAYAFHLFAWQLYCSPWTPLTPLIKFCCKYGVHKSNYFMKLMFGEKIKLSDVEAFRPMSGIRWQRRFFSGYYSACEIIEENYYFHVKCGLWCNYNVLDNDMLWYLVKENPKLVI